VCKKHYWALNIEAVGIGLRHTPRCLKGSAATYGKKQMQQREQTKPAIRNTFITGILNRIIMISTFRATSPLLHEGLLSLKTETIWSKRVAAVDKKKCLQTANLCTLMVGSYCLTQLDLHSENKLQK
jgi:hypothetical protein